MSQAHMEEERAADVVVVGAGLAGLAAAATAARSGRRVVLLDAHAPGGRAQVDRRDGFTFNRGPRALYANGPGRAVLDGLGVSTTDGSRPALGRSAAMRGGELHVLPQGFASLVRTRVVGASEKPGLTRLLATLPRIDPDRFAGMTADEAIAGMRLGTAAQDLVRALVRLSTYVAATDELDAMTAIAQLQAVLDGVLYLDGGWGSLVDRLVDTARAAGVDVRPGTAVRGLETSSRGDHVVVTIDGRRITAGAVVVATGAPETAASLLGERPAGWATGPAAVAACLELGLRRVPPTRFVLGVDEPLYLSTHCPPADLAPPGGAVVHLMRYGREEEDLPHEQVRARLRALAAAAGIRDDDVVQERFLSRMVVTGGIPTAPHGLAGRPPVEVVGHPGLLLAGDWVGPVGILGDAALASGAAAGRLAAARTGRLAVA